MTQTNLKERIEKLRQISSPKKKEPDKEDKALTISDHTLQTIDVDGIKPNMAEFGSLVEPF